MFFPKEIQASLQKVFWQVLGFLVNAPHAWHQAALLLRRAKKPQVIYELFHVQGQILVSCHML